MFANASFLKAFNLSPDQLGKTTVFDLHDPETARNMITMDQETLTTGLSRSSVQEEDEGGSVRHIRFPLAGRSGTPSSVCHIAWDPASDPATDKGRMESEIRFRTLFYTLPFPALIWHRQGDSFILEEGNPAVRDAFPALTRPGSRAESLLYTCPDAMAALESAFSGTGRPCATCRFTGAEHASRVICALLPGDRIAMYLQPEGRSGDESTPPESGTCPGTTGSLHEGTLQPHMGNVSTHGRQRPGSSSGNAPPAAFGKMATLPLHDLHRLTPAQLRVAQLVRDGATTMEIADQMQVSQRTVETHRKNLRDKLGLKNTKINLRTHLLSLPLGS